MPDTIQALFKPLERTVATLTTANLEAVVHHLRGANATPATLETLAIGFPQQSQRDVVRQLAWRWSRAPASSAELAAALVTLHIADGRQREPEVSWSGPATSSFSYRATHEIIREMIDTASRTLLLVSYSVKAVASLRVELESALARKVRLRFVLEHCDIFTKVDRTADFQLLGDAVLEKSRIYIWPVSKRPTVGPMVFGSMHTKCFVRDGRDVFFTSANWTTSAMMHNMEMGVTLRDRRMARKVEAHFDDLIATGHLREWKG